MVDDGRTTDGRTPDHGHPISSPCEPDGSGELITREVLNVLSDKGILVEKMVGVATDGAAVMTRKKSGVVQRITSSPGATIAHLRVNKYSH